MSARDHAPTACLRWLAPGLLLLIAGCSLAPNYHPPSVTVPAEYKPAANDRWTPATPADHVSRGAWWTVYGDARLDTLEKRLLAHNADLAEAAANEQRSQAYLDQLQAGLFPTLSANGQVQPGRDSPNRPLKGPSTPVNYKDIAIGGQLNYELDLWGRVRNKVASGRAKAQAAQADLASTQLSLAARLADTYLALSGLDRRIALLSDRVAAYRRSLDLVTRRHGAGLAAGVDVFRARTQLKAAKARVARDQSQRATLVNAIAVLVGTPASNFSLAPQTRLADLPIIPTGVPSTLLQRRPDIAAAERQTAAANARIGVAQAAYFPDITLGLGGGFNSGSFDNLLTAPSRYWTLGPSLMFAIFDAGRRRAKVEQAKAATDAAAARYRATVLQAFGQVEDARAQIVNLGAAWQQQKDAADAAARTVDLSTTRYRRGLADYIEVSTAQADALDARSEQIRIETDQLRASVALIRALGGGWASAGSERNNRPS
ncbi:efflux transporter outer membrane subunit [Salinisphaera sp. SPP-AMP-43]|uniref:efflux transporter outer membrane subunit n=1 Tax=Salinisphaera sp. SPP-AMP-43 TaxID=3121288 RepID=UPI003C6E477B